MLVATASFANDTISVVTYNLLFYDEIPQSRDTNFRKTILYIQPDVLVVQEIGSQANVDNFLTNVLNYYTPGLYTSAQFYNTSNLNVAMFYKPALFDLLNVVAIPTYPRDIMKYRLLHLKSGQVFDVFGLHLKAGNSSANMNDRNNEALQLRAYTNQYPVNFNYIVCGDFNFYGDFEPAYQTLLLNNGSDIGNFKDHLNLSGTWSNYEYRFHHSQSTRTRSFGGGATGGCDDRFDFFLFSPAVVNEGGMTYVQGSSVPIGNDGNHYNDSINERPVTAVPDSIADALHYASDHLPVNFQIRDGKFSEHFK
jgi:Endonuclease/Exonuclease/phosphatase family.